jgi:hypothetical protein
VEIRAASHALIDLVGDASALAAMLHCYSHKVGASQALLLKQHAAGEVQQGLGEWQAGTSCGWRRKLLQQQLHGNGWCACDALDAVR